MPVIKRYANRKLYDSGTRRYVTLDDLAEMVRHEEDVQVIDHQTGDDLTAATLLQVVFEEEKRIGGLLPQVMLTRLIRTGGTAFLGMREAVYAFLDPAGYVERGIRRRLERLVALGRLSAEESGHIEQLLLDEELECEDGQQEELVSVDQIEELMREVLRLEEALKELETRT
ncbi:MAG: polyhydroxyalkanoate synthesis regulator DNA-binding domain-containing protein [Anaerolineaceae bacterium]|nr:polyhydroxyalkanoate synthesis regulator DNA-binding domain-containing protein [Anaerolineaceae bacterium]